MGRIHAVGLKRNRRSETNLVGCGIRSQDFNFINFPAIHNPQLQVVGGGNTKILKY